MSRILPLAAALCLAALPAAAQTVTPCSDLASLRNIAEPWAENSRTFANGDVRLTLLDTLEPAVAPFHLALLSPPYNEVGDRQCRMISRAADLGFSALFFEEMEAGYNPATGLTFTLPGIMAAPGDPETGISFMLDVTLNQATGQVSVSRRITSQ